MDHRPHIPVMLKECLEYFAGRNLHVFFEGTLGAAGHAEAILKEHPEIQRYLATDRDPLALQISQERLSPWADKIDLIHGDFGDLDAHLEERRIKNVDGFFFDLGVSSMQFDQGEKGFSFSKEGPLDMRMDPTSGITAAEVINHWPEKKLGEIFRDYGEERKWRPMAKAIVEARRRQKFETTTQLADFISSLFRSKPGKHLHPATLVFQALRICVNHELDSLQNGLNKAIEKLSPGGRIGVISFHSLEDRIVKNVFRDASTLTREQKERREDVLPVLKLLTKKPLVPTLSEMRQNPRARSAKLRFAEKNTL